MDREREEERQTDRDIEFVMTSWTRQTSLIKSVFKGSRPHNNYTTGCIPLSSQQRLLVDAEGFRSSTVTIASQWR